VTTDSILEAVEQAEYAGETDVYRDWLAGLEDPEEVKIDGETYSVEGIHTEYTPSMCVTNSRLKKQKGKPDTLCLGLSCQGDILILTTYGTRNRVWKEINSIKIEKAASS
jgi:hypothetical protein